MGEEYSVANRIVHILLVEDDEVDVEAVQRAFKQHDISNPITVVGNGADALDCLRGQNGFARLPRPYQILLDLNLPRMSGIEFLGELRNDAELRRSVVFVLTSSARDEDMLAAYDRFVAGYLLKSRVGRDFVNLFEMLRIYWAVVEFPPEAAAA